MDLLGKIDIKYNIRDIVNFIEYRYDCKCKIIRNKIFFTVDRFEKVLAVEKGNVLDFGFWHEDNDLLIEIVLKFDGYLHKSEWQDEWRKVKDIAMDNN